MNVLDNFYKNIDYKTLKNFQKITEVNAIISFCIAEFDIVYEEIQTYGTFLVASVISAYMYRSLIAEKNILKTEDISSIKCLYDDILKEYNKLIDIFSFENPIELYAMFVLMYSKGYISLNKTFEFSEPLTDEFIDLSGLNIILGNGVCRNISFIFKDILNLRKIDNHILPVLIKKINSESPKKSIIKNHFGNHVINMVKKDDVCYYLDPTNEIIFQPRDKKNLISEEYEAKINTASFRFLNEVKKQNIMKLIVSSENNIEQNKIVETKTLEICKENIDIFEKFYEENKEKYEEMSDKIKILKLK